MKRCVSLLFCLLLSACASAPPPAPPERLLRDELFSAPLPQIDATAIFALSPEMKRYADVELAPKIRSRGLYRGLLEALYSKQQLKLEYDAERTRNAQEAFDARAGNCLSLVIMTAAFAQHLGLKVTYQSVYTDETWTRNQDTYFASGHVNLTLGPRATDITTRGPTLAWTIDFLPPEDLRGQRSREVSEATIVAMYMNNRAAESLAAGDVDAAYAWARAAVKHEPGFLSAYNTLGVVYLRRGDASAAEQVLAHVLQRDPASTIAMANMVRVLGIQGRADDSRALAARLTRIDPEPPFHFFDLGQAAMRSGNYAAARDWFAKEVARAPYHHEFHFWLAMADYQLGDVKSARKQLDLALSTSTTRRNQQLYAAKLDRLRHLGVQ
jgi:tetratricopeptide (TPR) repeat protein